MMFLNRLLFSTLSRVIIKYVTANDYSRMLVNIPVLKSIALFLHCKNKAPIISRNLVKQDALITC